MHQMIFVNLPVADLDASRAFFSKVGYAFNEQFSDDKALCLMLGDNLFAMLLRRDFFAGFTPRPVADATATSEVLVALSAASREDVDSIVGRALDAGGSEVRDPMDEGFMYARAYADLDGHIWEVLWMDPSHVQG